MATNNAINSPIAAGLNNQVTTTSQALLANNGYDVNNASLCTLTLPVTCAEGSIFEINGQGAGGWKVAQNAGQQIIFGILSTTSGTGGSVASTQSTDAVRIICLVASTTFKVVSAQAGGLTIV